MKRHCPAPFPCRGLAWCGRRVEFYGREESARIAYRKPLNRDGMCRECRKKIEADEARRLAVAFA